MILLKRERLRLTISIGFRFHLGDQRRFTLGFQTLEGEELIEIEDVCYEIEK